jgi:HAD superfamily hydrolase (TIGR01509 family)
MFKAIFWDNDGVLVNTEPLFFQATKEVLKRIGIKYTEGFMKEQQLTKNISAFDLAKEKGINENEIKEIRKDRNDIYMEMLQKEIEPMKYIEEVLIKLHGNYKMGIVTSSRLDHFEMIMKSAKLKKYFDFIITNQNVTHEKPDPEPYLLALKKSGLKTSECLVIEDAERGVIAAKKAGLSCYAIPNEMTQGNDFSQADKVLKSAKELLTLL